MVVQATLWRFLFNNSGATAIEYAMLASGIALAIIAAVNALGNTVATKFYQELNSRL